MKSEIRFAGYGGQGIALMGVLTGRAAVLHDKKEAVFTQSYGPEARGGASSADVIVSEDKIDFPLVTRPDFLVVLFQEAYQRYHPGLKDGGTLILDEDLVHPNGNSKKYYRIPATKMAERLGKKIVANVVMLGYFAAVSRSISRRALEEALKGTVKPSALDLNLKALAMGFEHLK